MNFRRRPFDSGNPNSSDNQYPHGNKGKNLLVVLTLSVERGDDLVEEHMNRCIAGPPLTKPLL